MTAFRVRVVCDDAAHSKPVRVGWFDLTTVTEPGLLEFMDPDLPRSPDGGVWVVSAWSRRTGTPAATRAEIDTAISRANAVHAESLRIRTQGYRLRCSACGIDVRSTQDRLDSILWQCAATGVSQLSLSALAATFGRSEGR